MPKDQERFDVIAERESGLVRGLSTEQLSLIAIGGAIGTGLFLGSGYAISMAGPAVLLSYSIGALITLLLMGALAEMTVAHPTTGSFGAWAEFYVSPMAGFLVRACYWAAVVFAVGTEVTAVALYMRLWFPALPGLLWIVLFGAAIVTVNATHVEMFGRVEFALSALKLAAIAAFLVLGAMLLSSHTRPAGTSMVNLTAGGGFFARGFAGMWSAVIIAFFSYLSVEMIAVAAGEARNPRQAIVHAFRSTFARLLLFYLLTLAVILSLVPWNATRATQGPFVTVMQQMHIPAAIGVVNFVLLVAALSAMNSQLYITTRMLFSLARAGDAPRVLGVVAARGVPVPALLVSAAGIAVAAIVNAVSPDKAFARMMAIAIFGGMFTWLMIFITHIRFRRVHAGRTLAFRMPGFPATSLLGAALMIALLVTTAFTDGFRLTLTCGIPFLAVLMIFYLVRARRVEKGVR